jgi:hypothetical protein
MTNVTDVDLGIAERNVVNAGSFFSVEAWSEIAIELNRRKEEVFRGGCR